MPDERSTHRIARAMGTSVTELRSVDIFATSFDPHLAGMEEPSRLPTSEQRRGLASIVFTHDKPQRIADAKADVHAAVRQ